VYLCGLLDQGYADYMRMNNVSVTEDMSASGSPSVDLKPILKEYLSDILERDLEQHRSTPPKQGVYVKDRLYEEQTRADADLSFLSSLRGQYLEALEDRDISLVENDALALMERHGVPEHQRLELCFGLMQTFVKSLQVSEQRVRGEYPDVDVQLTTIPQGLVKADEQAVATADGQPHLSELLPEYFEHQVKETGWSQQTLKQNKATIERFIELVGDKPIQSYVREHLGEFYTVALKVPAKWGQTPEWRNMTWKDLVAATKGDETIPRLTKRTLERHFHALGGLFKHYKQIGKYKGENPANGFTFPSGKGKSVTLGFDRQMWEGEKIVQLFGSPLWQGCKTENKRYLDGNLIIKDDKYWLPLLGLYHGNRLEEFAQLTRADILSEDGITYFNLQDELEGNHLKNEQSKRRVPVHPMLIKWGFLDYVDEVTSASEDRIFPQLQRAGPDNKFGVTFSKWFTRYRQKIGAYERGLDYHSFRHGVVTKLYEASVASVVINQLVGHEGQGTGQQEYLKGLSIQKLYKGISRVNWPEVEELFHD